MALSIEDMREWLAVLRAHPELKAEVRREVLSEELLSLPELVRQNGEDIRALKEVVAQNSADIQALKEVVAQNSADIRQNSADIQALKEVVAQNSADIQALTAQVAKLTVSVTRMDGRLGSLEGRSDELSWRFHFAGRFGRIISRAKLVEASDLDAFEDAFDSELITDAEALAVRRADLLITGARGKGPERQQVVLVVEVSRTIEDYDVLRARNRAETLRKVGYNAVPVVAGSVISEVLREEAGANGVEIVINPPI